jgi:hypothetical protein
LEIKNKGVWYYFDPNMEPYMNLAQRRHNSWNESNDSLKKYYDVAKHPNLSYQFGEGKKAEFGPVNEIPAQRLRFFQSTTGILSKLLWCFPLIILFAKKRRVKMYAVKPIRSNAYPTGLKPSFS